MGVTALGVGVAGCSSGDEGGQSNGGGNSGGGSGGSAATETGGTSKSGSGETATSAGQETAGKDASATEMTGTVADKSASGLTFVEQNHYEMNGVQGVVGRVKNTSGAPFEEITVHTTVKPGDAGPYTETMDDALKPGETWRFKFKFGDGAPDEVKGYTIWATGEKA